MNSRFAAYENRLNEVERLTAENFQLKFALVDANQLIATLQAEVKRLNATPKDAPMLDAVPPIVSVSPATSGNLGSSSAATGVSDGSFFAGNSSVSKYASLPATAASKQAKVSRATSAPAASAPNTTEFTTVKRKRKSKKPVPPSAAALAAFARKFSSASDPSSANGYRFVYYKASKHLLSWYRSQLLPMVGVNDSRVLDIHFPTQRVVSFLLHSDFVLEFTSIMHQKLKHDPLLDFDPLEDKNLLDPAFASLDSVSRAQKLRDLQNIRVLRALTFVRPSVRVSVAKSMLLQDFIS
ncbi:hypothetical protein FB192DRAFT_1396736 [Mucor lusitanicus]|uniref:Uncharacterized protein n=1 Tax=Mucor circinelloides f. lusitanicus TaxID=29924 RepID=A0A8H4EX97_MUCCL|nr:hypothetical protein FB192DRAFT_1396736 [Mucor lusitanicus]